MSVDKLPSTLCDVTKLTPRQREAWRALQNAVREGLTEAETARKYNVNQNILNMLKRRYGVNLVRSKFGRQNIPLKVYYDAISKNPGKSLEEIAEIVGVTGSSMRHAYARLGIKTPHMLKREELRERRKAIPKPSKLTSFDKAIKSGIGEENFEKLLKLIPAGISIQEFVCSCIVDVCNEE